MITVWDVTVSPERVVSYVVIHNIRVKLCSCMSYVEKAEYTQFPGRARKRMKIKDLLKPSERKKTKQTPDIRIS